MEEGIDYLQRHQDMARRQQENEVAKLRAELAITAHMGGVLSREDALRVVKRALGLAPDGEGPVIE